VRNGQLVPLRREEWKTMHLEDQFDALLYLGQPSSMTDHTDAGRTVPGCSIRQDTS
jgi:hypothetical protein